jgi:hypothetical protein
VSLSLYAFMDDGDDDDDDDKVMAAVSYTM